MIREIIDIAAERGMEITPLIDHYALNAYLDRRHGLDTPSYYVMLTKQSEIRNGIYTTTDVERIELVAVMETELTNDDKVDYDNVSEAARTLKEGLMSIVNAIGDSDQFDSVENVSFNVIPYRYDSFMTAVTATFNLVKPYSQC